MRELDAYVASGSQIVIVADLPDVEASLHAVRANLRNEAVEVRRGDTTDRGVLDQLNPRAFDHLIILCYSDTLDAQLADSRTLIQ